MDKRKRYQIFVSSTFRDLEEERGKVMETILYFDCFPAGMELFPARGEEKFEFIKKKIDESDYYLLIIGGRYGSVDESSVSWTEREYDYAVSKHIPILAFIHNDFSKLNVDQVDRELYKQKKLNAFKKKVAKGKLIKHWNNADNLAVAVATSLKSVLEQKPRIGWVRADSIPSDDFQKEFEKLQKEVKGLKDDLMQRDADITLKDRTCQVLESSYRAAEQEIENYKKQIESLEKQIEEHKKRIKTLERLCSSQAETFTVNGVSFKMVHVDGGTFMMGADKGDNEAWDDEKPLHEVTLSDYWMGETPVTQALWQAVMRKNPSKYKGKPNCPVECVSWNDCQVFIQKLSKLTGKQFHLPTEAQWEYAARGGNKSMGYKYAGSDNIAEVAWYVENSNHQTHPVGELEPNELGFYDMSGNVWEWCQDRFGKKYYENSQIKDPTGPDYGFYRVLRGGHWESITKFCRVSCRNHPPTFTSGGIGLRLAIYSPLILESTSSL